MSPVPGVRAGPLRRVGRFLLRTGSGRGRGEAGLRAGGEVREQARSSVGPVLRDGPGAAGADPDVRGRQSQPETPEHEGRAGHRVSVRTQASPGRSVKGEEPEQAPFSVRIGALGKVGVSW